MIESTVFFDYLKLDPFFLSLSKGERSRLEPFFVYWNKYAANQDERKFAYVLANYHHGERKVPSQSEVALRFAIEDEVWTDVRVIDGLRGPSDPHQLADVFYTVLSRIRPLSLEQILTEELKSITGAKVDGTGLDAVFKEFHKRNLAALCFSGGGIRSATFGLGIVQALAKNNVLSKFDYLSTVSGGGYLGSWLSAWVLRQQLRAGSSEVKKAVIATEEAAGADVIEGLTSVVDLPDQPAGRASTEGVKSIEGMINGCAIDGTGPNPEPKELQHLREYSNYMSPRTGLLSADTWSLIAIYLRNLFLNQTIFIPLIAAALLLPRFFYLVIGLKPADDNFGPVAWITLFVAAALGVLSMIFVIKHLPSRQAEKRDKANQNDNEARARIAAAAQAVQAVRASKDIDSRKNASKSVDVRPAELEANPDENTDVGVLIRSVFPLLLCGICASSLWAWNYRSNKYALYEHFDLLNVGIKENPVWALNYFLIVVVIAFVVGGLVLYLSSRPIKPSGMESFAALVASIVGAVLLWLVCVKLVGDKPFNLNLDGYEWQLYLSFAVPLFLLIVLIAATVFVGLSSGRASDEDREWLARYGAWVLIVAVVWTLLNLVVLVGPSLLEAVFSVPLPDLGFWNGITPTLVAAAGIISGIVSLLGGFSEKSQVRSEPVQTRTSRFLAHAPKVAAVIFLGFIFVILSYLTSVLIYALSTLFAPNGWTGMPSHAEVLANTHILFFFVALVTLSFIGVFMAFFVNVNKFSLHGAYRDRLVRAYLGASNTSRRKNSFTGFDDRDNFQLHRLKDQKPFHVINATLNLVAGKTLAWQNRKAASFTMSPLHCGSWTLGYRNTNEYCRNASLGPCKDLDACNKVDRKCALQPDGKTPVCEIPGKAIRLGTAMAISGAAANPNMGYYSSSVVTFLMSLFNIRLGWWLGNTNEIGARLDQFKRPFYSKSSPTVAVLPLLNEMLGRTDEGKRYINVTDGGHFENLAVYEMVLRRCKLIVLSDGAADESFKFGEIANAIQKCKVDLGVDIRLLGSMNIRRRTTRETKVDGSRFAIAEITYPEKGDDGKNLKGYLVYTRPTYYATTEPRDIMNYADSNAKFPHQSTGDQMYDEKQFEAYRGLGFYTMSEIQNIFRATAIGDPEDLVDDELELLFYEEEDMRKTLFKFFGLKDDPEQFRPRPKGTGGNLPPAPVV